MKHHKAFRHESLQDAAAIKELLQSIGDALLNGELLLEDEDDSLTLKPSGLLKLKVSARQEDALNKLNIRVSWEDSKAGTTGKKLKVKNI